MDTSETPSGYATPDSGIGPSDYGSNSGTNSFGTPDLSRRSSADSGISGFSSNSKGVDPEKLMSALSEDKVMTQEDQTQGQSASLGSYMSTNSSRPASASSFQTTASSGNGGRSNNSGQSIQVNISGPNNKTVPISIRMTDTIDQLIIHASRTLGLGSNQSVYLTYEGKTLEKGSGQNVQSVGIRDKSLLCLCTRVTGGCLTEVIYRRE